MYCPNCGKEINGNEQYCDVCGCQLDANRNAPIQPAYSSTNSVDEKSIGFNILSFFIPIVGLVLYLVWKDEYPIKAKSCGKSALISVIVSFVLPILLMFISSFLFAIMKTSITPETSTIPDMVLMCSSII